MKTKTKTSGGGVSLRSKDAMRGIGMGPGPFTITGAEYGMHDYGGTRKAVAACFVTFERNGEETAEPYTCGQGWKIADDRQSLIPKAGQTGLPDNCKFMHLIRSLEECGMPEDYLGSPSDLTGIAGTLILKPLGKIEDRKKKPGAEKAEAREYSALVVEEIESAPWLEDGGKKSAGKKKAAAADDDEEDEADEDEDEAPARGKGGKAAKAADEDEDEADEGDKDAESDDEDLDELAGEALIEALEDGPIKLKSVEDAVFAQVKKHKQGKAIAKHAASKKFLDREKGWDFDGKIITAS